VAKLQAMSGVGLSPKVTGVAVAGVLLLGAAVTLFTGGRAQALGAAVNEMIDGRMAAVGFRLEKVHIEGASPDALPAIKQALGLYRGQPLARMDLNELKGRVEAVGWVREAKVLRLLPDTLVIAVTERERLAVWQHGGRTEVIDSQGRVIQGADPARYAGLPLVVGEGADVASGAILPLVRQRPRLADRLEAVVRVDGRRWDLRLKDGSLIQLPAVNEDSALIQLDQLDQRARVLELGFARIDLRDPEMIAVRPRGGAEPVPQPAAPPAGPADI
jgi:cell division protein FtsQ